MPKTPQIQQNVTPTSQKNGKIKTRGKNNGFQLNATERKRKSRSNPQQRQLENERKRKERKEKKISDLLFFDDLKKANEKITRLEKQIANLECLLQPTQAQEDIVSRLDLEEENFDVNVENSPWWTKIEKNIENFQEKVTNLHRIIGVDQELFDQLVVDIEPDFVNINWDGTRKQKVCHKGHIKIGSALFLTLLWLRNYPTMLFLQCMFDLHERSLARILKRTIRALELTLEPEQVFGHQDDLMAKIRPEDEGTALESIICWVDGTLINTPRSLRKFAQGDKDPLFSGKHKKTGVKLLLIADNEGHIMWNTKIFPGARNDQGIWNDSNTRETFLDKRFGIGGDMGFSFNTKKDEKEIISVRPKSIKNSKLTPEEREIVKLENWMISNSRVIIENVIGRLKQWKIIDGLCRHYHPNRVGTSKQRNVFDLNVIVEVLCGIHNRDLKYHPMR